MDVDTISTSSFHKKYDEIYSHNHDHTYAINENHNMTINRVDHDCLAEIFSYLPATERPRLALVCDKWRRALTDSWFSVHKLELKHWECNENLNGLKKYPTIDRQFSFLKSLLNKCGYYLTELDLTAYDNCNILPVINHFCPKLVKLRLRFTSIDNEMLSNTFTRLSKLKSLTIIFHNIKTNFLPSTLINSLSNVAETLTELKLLNWPDTLSDNPIVTEDVHILTCYLEKLKILELSGVQISRQLFEYLITEKINYLNHTVDISRVLSTSEKLINITTLKMKNCPIMDETLYTIANIFKNLQLLHINGNWVTDFGVVTLTKMNKLKYLTFDGCTPMVTNSSVELFKNMIKLTLPISRKVTDDSIMKIIENSPMIEMLSVYGSNVTAELVKKASEISNNRKRRLILCVEIMPNIQQYESLYFEIHRLHISNGKIVLYDDRSVYADEVVTSSEGQAQILAPSDWDFFPIFSV